MKLVAIREEDAVVKIRGIVSLKQFILIAYSIFFFIFCRPNLNPQLNRSSPLFYLCCVIKPVLTVMFSLLDLCQFNTIFSTGPTKSYVTAVNWGVLPRYVATPHPPDAHYQDSTVLYGSKQKLKIKIGITRIVCRNALFQRSMMLSTLGKKGVGLILRHIPSINTLSV